MLICPIQLCLAHYCDLHGPTPLMVTEGFPAPCSICSDDASTDGSGAAHEKPRPRAPTSGEAAQAVNITEALRRLDLAASQTSSGSAAEQDSQSHQSPNVGGPSGTGSSAIETPPQSPRIPHQKSRQDSGFRRTYDDYVTRRAGPCENCALTLPKGQGTGGDALVDPSRGPILRTRAPCARVFTGIDTTSSPPLSQSSSSAPSDDESTGRPTAASRPSHRRTGTAVSVTSRSSGASSTTSSAANANSHMHYIYYTSTHEPLAPASFSLVRASCLRTLSLETLPRTPATAIPAAAPGAIAGAIPTPNAPTPSNTVPGSPASGGSFVTTPSNTVPGSPASGGSFVTTHSIGAAASGGSIFFGDKKVGYTTAYIFRVPDVHARGHKRVYAFLALSTYPEATAVKTFTFLSAAFRDLAGWIQELAEAEAERAAQAAQNPLHAQGRGQGNYTGNNNHHGQGQGAEGGSGSGSGSGSSAASSPVVPPGSGYGSSFHSHSEHGGFGHHGHAQQGPIPPPPAPLASGTSNASTSSFLTSGGGLSRRMGGGLGGGFGGAGAASSIKQRGLPELVGLPDFFIQLHAKFVRLLLEIGVVVGS
ncbi:hypothetical protein VTJ04DRAFT_7112 [Mycothermus thermophilus]|uniref:uncharacterized protein n=1 Tax=Humicola insolens TaxID=85995 RepID=UPI0037449144